MTFLLWVLGLYITYGLGMYAYAVTKSHDVIGSWNFNIRDGYIAGWIKYPKWVLWWLEGFIDVITARKVDE